MKKNLYAVALTSVALSLFACAPQTPTPTQPQGIMPVPLTRVNQIIRAAEARGEKKVQVLDVSQGKARTDAAIALTLNFADINGFATKNTSGTAPTLITDINDYYVYLYQCTSVPTAGASGSETDLDAGASGCTHSFSAAVTDNNTGAQTFVFANVPPNTASNSYVVGVVARNGSGNSLNTTTGNSGGYTDTDIGHPSNGPLSLTRTGGDGTGTVSVNASNVVSSLTDLGAVIRLSDGVGATLNAATVITPGNATTGPITLN